MSVYRSIGRMVAPVLKVAPRFFLRNFVAPAVFSECIPVRVRRTVFETVARFLPEPAGYAVSQADMDELLGEWVVADNAHADQVILYLHGGGYCIGSPSSHRGLAARLSRASGAGILLPDYRLAPEHRCLAAVEDAVTAYRFLLQAGYDPHRIILAGDSAGGGLAVAAAVSLRDHNDPLPAALMCISPWVDLSHSEESIPTRAAVDPFVSEKTVRFHATQYLGDMDPCSPLCSPVFADLTGLPQIIIHVGEDEILLQDSMRLAQRARGNQVPVQLDVWKGMWHVWHFFGGLIPEADQAIEALGRFSRMSAFRP